MNRQDTIESIQKMLESFILSDINVDHTFYVEWADVSQAYIIYFTFNIDVMRMLEHSPTFDEEYKDKCIEINDWPFGNDIIKTLRKYLSIFDVIFLEYRIEYKNMEQVQNQISELKKDIEVLNQKGKEFESYSIENAVVRLNMLEEIIEIRIIIDGDVQGRERVLMTDIGVTVYEKYDYLQDIVNLFGDIIFDFYSDKEQSIFF
jgi:hypothetical protein